MIVDEDLIVKALTPIGIPKFAGVQLRYNCPRCSFNNYYIYNKNNE